MFGASVNPGQQCESCRCPNDSEGLGLDMNVGGAEGWRPVHPFPLPGEERVSVPAGAAPVSVLGHRAERPPVPSQS